MTVFSFGAVSYLQAIRTTMGFGQKSSVTSVLYCTKVTDYTKILLPYVRLLRDALDLDFLFTVDSGTVYHTVTIVEFLESE